MIKLGSWPSDRYSLSWITQRLVNRAPEQSHARKAPASMAKQILNPIGNEIKTTTQQLLEEKENVLPSIANIDLLSHLYEVDLQPSLSFSSTQNEDGSIIYDVPNVYVSLNNDTYEITQAQRNNIETLAYSALPSRIEDGEITKNHFAVIDKTVVDDLFLVQPNNPVLPSHLYITIEDNATWQTKVGDTIYYSKVFIKGKTRKRTDVTEAIPIRYNGTFKTVNQWKEIEEIFVSYIDSEASISIDIFPWYGNGLIDTRNLVVDVNDEEKWRFINLNSRSYGHNFISESYTTNDFDIIRQGQEARDIEHEIELHDENGNNLEFDAFTMKPYTDYLHAISGSSFYVYNTQLEYPDVTRIIDESPDTKMDLYAEKWIFARDEEAVIKTRNLDFREIPLKTRWSIETPSLQKYYILVDGSFTSNDSWDDNSQWELGKWTEQERYITLTENGTYIVTFEASYIDEITGQDSILTTKYLFYTPSIRPEVVLELPDTITDVEDMSFDSDGKLWVKVEEQILLLNVYYDYFIADYLNNRLYLREQYSSVRIEV